MKLERSTRYANGYTLIGNEIFREKELSLKAKGLFCLMWSLPEDWNFSIEGLVCLGVDGKDSVRAALMELGQYGYMARKQLRNDDGSLSGMSYILTDRPLSGNPHAAPSSGFPTAGNPTQLNTKEEIPKESISSKSNKGVRKRFTIPTPEEVDVYCTERNNGISGQNFVDFYTSKGWMVGKTPMKDWKAAVRTWEQQRKQQVAAGGRDRRKEQVDYD